MGNTSKRGPKTDKTKYNSENKYLQYGLCEMQGWRGSMEDATISALDFDPNSCVFGVLDGHGGSIVSKFVASNFVNILTHMKSYKQEKKYDQALIDTFLKFDELLRLKKVNDFLKRVANKRNEGKLDLSFAYGYQTEFGGQVSLSQANNYLTPDDKDDTKAESPRKKSPRIVYFEGTSGKEESKRMKEINDKNKDPSSYSSNNSEPSVKSDSTGKLSKEILTMNSHKIEISTKGNNENASPDELIAKDMGTTANILLIKNNYIYLANVGDSLAVLFKNGVAIRLNQEHKTTLPSEYSRITKSGSKIINNRVEGRLNLTRALGDLTFKKNQNLNIYEQPVTAYPEITQMKINKDFDFIIMACDGVWDCVDAQKLCEHISIKLKSCEKISNIIEDLFDQIISKTNNTPVGTDNMSCILIQFIHE